MRIPCLMLAFFLFSAVTVAQEETLDENPGERTYERVDESVPASAVEAAAPSVRASARASADQLLLDSTSIRGNQELPRVMYIVPWKDPRLGDVVGKPVNSLIDEVLAPVDRDVFRRQTKYFDQLYGSERSGNGK